MSSRTPGDRREGTPLSLLYKEGGGGLSPKGVIFSFIVYERVGKFVVLVF